jgi:uncharacterized protein (DUF362 family)
MKTISRRKFLKIATMGAGAVALSACLPKAQPTEPILSPEPLNTPFGAATDTPSPIQPAATESPTFVAQPNTSLPDITVAKTGEPEDLVRRAVGAIGGMGRFVPSGANVVIKPNMCVDYRTYEYAATTNPWVVGALVKMAFEAGAKTVHVLDFPFGGTYMQAYKNSGIQEQVEASGGEMIPIKKVRYVNVSIPNAVTLTQTQIYDEILNAEVLINVPIAKQHGSAGLTLSMKNLMGTIWDRPVIHWDFGNNLTDLNTRVCSTLVVMDAVRILTYGGPQGGDLSAVQKLDTVLASTDVVAADAYAAKNFFAWNPTDLDSVRVGAERGLGRADLENLNIVEV